MPLQLSVILLTCGSSPTICMHDHGFASSNAVAMMQLILQIGLCRMQRKAGTTTFQMLQTGP